VSGVSDDGTRVAFTSFADNLVPRDKNEFGDAFVYDRKTHKTTRASVSSDEKQGAQGGIATDLSSDGRYVVFYAAGHNLVPNDTNHSEDVFVRDLDAGTTERVSVASGGVQANSYSHNEAQINPNGCLITFDSGASNLVPNDTNSRNDVFVRDRCNDETTRVSVTTEGTQGNANSTLPHISADGSRVAFVTEASTLGGPDDNQADDVFLATR
jgi:Tol biopolymer transport system component